MNWKKIILHIDMNAFFASIEQRDNIELQGKPVAVTNGKYGSCIITCSYEARAFGIKTGMRFSDARLLCPQIIRKPSNPKKYAKTSTQIMKILQNISPDVEIFSVDEAFIDITNCKKIYRSPLDVACLIKDRIYSSVCLPCSIGISENKSMAKFAAKLRKPDGITVLNIKKAKEVLESCLVTELCGVSKGIQKFLNTHNVYKCGDMKKIPISILGNRYGNVGRKIWLMAQGLDYDSLKKDDKQPKSFGHGKVTIPGLKDVHMIKKIFRHMCEKVAKRMRVNNFESNKYIIGFKTWDGWYVKKFQLAHYTNNGSTIYKLAELIISEVDHSKGINQVQVTASNPKILDEQHDIFGNTLDSKAQKLDNAIDAIHHKFVNVKIGPARLLGEASSPDVISPSWRPNGWKRSV
tara:strand:- start:211 stop:1431 length:1221 start_codon:yes stop_codon:yes gene_type:complete